MDFEVIIIGGSYAGLSAGLALGRSIRKVLIVDADQPCNAQTPHSHNFLTHDGESPKAISAKAKAEVLRYPTVKFVHAMAVSAAKIKNGFEVILSNGKRFTTRRILLSTGLRDVMPNIPGFSDCWAISIIHCPYCHGYEVKDQKIALLMNGEIGFEMAKMISHWNTDLTILTNGKSTFTKPQAAKLESKSIAIVEDEILSFEHENGQLKQVLFRNGQSKDFKAIYAKPKMEQHSDLHTDLGCELNDNGLIKINEQYETTTAGVYAAGDCSVPYRGLSAVASSGTLAAVMINREMISADF